MTEFHEGECPDDIGLGCGVWEMRVQYLKKVHPTYVGQSPSGAISFHKKKSNAIKIIVVVVVWPRLVTHMV